MQEVKIIGAGLAGCEAALQLAKRGIAVKLYEMRPKKYTPAHHSENFAELVCSNSLKSLDQISAAGTLKYELISLGSVLIRKAFESMVAAGNALAVDRDLFSELVTKAINAEPLIEVITEEIIEIPDPPVIIASGPLTSDSLASSIQKLLGADFLAFYDAAAPVVLADSLDKTRVFAQSRYGKGGGDDYLNAPIEKDLYLQFIEELVKAERVIERDFERKDLFSACQPVEEIARTGIDALRFGALKPVGITYPGTDKRPWAIVQLRSENANCTAYNLVGFQTNLKFGEQERIFKMIPGLEDAEFVRYGVMHRNTFIDSPHCLGKYFEIPSSPPTIFAGQITGTEGYSEAIASGLHAALAMYAHLSGEIFESLPTDTLMGSLFNYATDSNNKNYQPMHVNYGVIDPLPYKVKEKRQRYAAYAKRARSSIDDYRQRLCEKGLIPKGIDLEIPKALQRHLDVLEEDK